MDSKEKLERLCVFTTNGRWAEPSPTYYTRVPLQIRLRLKQAYS